MKKIITASVLAAALLASVAALPARAEDTLGFGVGYYDINDNEDAADFRVEYRWDKPVLWVIKPWLGAEATSDGAVYAAGGIYADMELDEQWSVTPSFGAGLYGDGSGKDLGHTVEFRSQIELGYTLPSQSTIGIAFGHISNASLGDRNPGTEILNLYYHIPVSRLFGGGSSTASSSAAYSNNDSYYGGGYGSEYGGY